MDEDQRVRSLIEGIGGVVFATPSYSHTCCMEYLAAALSTEQAMTKLGIPHAWLLKGGDPYLAKIRNRIVTEYLRDYPDMQNLFFLDDDVGWPPQKIIDFLLRPEPVLAGIYPKKSEKVDFPVELACDRETGLLRERDGLVQGLSAGMGFVRIKRYVLEQMASVSMKYTESRDEPLEYFHNIFSMGMGDDGQWWGEDYVFFKKWTNSGGEMWIDPDIDFTHTGKRSWKGNFSEHLALFREKGAELLAAGKLKIEAIPVAAV